MKFDCGPTWDESLERKQKWHRWFAWRPVRVASKDCRWLETVDRKGTYKSCGDFWVWEYRGRP